MSKEQTMEFLEEKRDRLGLVYSITMSPSEKERVGRALDKTERRIKRLRLKAKGVDKACNAVCKFLRKLAPVEKPVNKYKEKKKSYKGDRHDSRRG